MKLEFANGGSADLPEDIVALAEAFKSDMMDARELLYLAATLRLYPWRDDGIVVEIGAYHGRTTVFMAQVLALSGSRPPVLSIDVFDRAVPDAFNPRGSFSTYRTTILAHGLEHQCMPLTAWSEDAAPVLASNIGVLVVDGGHQYPVVIKDLRLFAPKVKPGGLIFIDDYGPAYPDVVRAVDEYFSGNRLFEWVHTDYFVIARRLAPAGAEDAA